MKQSNATPVFVVLLNWNGWRDTVRCLVSLFGIVTPEFAVVVCDNDSSDGSLDHIAAWASGQRDAASPEDSVLKPIPYRRFSRTEAEHTQSAGVRLILIQNGANLGFAGGCNVGIRHALVHRSCEYVWILNNDTVMEPMALEEMLTVCRANPKVGICGSQVRFFGSRGKVQSFGGRLNTWFCTAHHLFCGSDASEIVRAPTRIDYVPGVSMLVTRPFLEHVGLMAEDYFLYFEEIDWAERGKSHYELAVCMKSIVYHVGGSSIGSPGEQGERGARSDYLLLRGRALFAKKFYRQKLITVYLGLLASVLRRILRGRWSRAWLAYCALTGVRPRALKLPPNAVTSEGVNAPGTGASR